MQLSARLALFAVCGVMLVCIVAGVAAISTPFGAMRQLMNTHSPKSNAGHFTANLWYGIQFGAGYLVVLSSLVLVLVLRARQRIQKKLTEYLPSRDLLVDIRMAFTLSRPEWMALTTLFMLGFLFRLYQMQRMLHVDEIWTAFTFSRNPLTAIIEYWTTNNHILHSFLLALTLPFFGDSPWAIRGVAFVTGILIIPLTYVWVRGLVPERPTSTALLATAVVSCNPLLCQYSACARGYCLQALLAVMAWVVADRFCRGRNDYLFLLSTICALALWTMPTSVIIVAGVFLVVAYHVLRRDVRLIDGVWLTTSTLGLAGCLWLPALLFRGALICYNEPAIFPWGLLPRILQQGVAAITDVRSLACIPQEVQETFSERLNPFFHAATLLTPTDYLIGAVGSGYERFQLALFSTWSPVLLAVALIIAIGVVSGPSRWRPIAIGGMGACLLLLTCQGVSVPLRAWVFVVPLAAVAFSVGTLTVVQWIGVRTPLVVANAAAIGYLGLCVPSIVQNHPTHADAEKIAEGIAAQYDHTDEVDIINFSGSRGRYLWPIDYYIFKALAGAGWHYEVRRQCQCQYYPWQEKPKESKIRFIEASAEVKEETPFRSNVVCVTYLSEDVTHYWNVSPRSGKWETIAGRWVIGRQIAFTPAQ
jgi:hypothetical protein